MATIEELYHQYQTDDAMKKEVKDILADGKVSPLEFLSFCKKHNVSVSLDELSNYLEYAKKLGFSFPTDQLSKYIDMAKKFGLIK